MQSHSIPVETIRRANVVVLHFFCLLDDWLLVFYLIVEEQVFKMLPI